METNFTSENFQLRPIFILITLLFSAPSFGQTKHIVQVSNNIYTPEELVISAGDTVEWLNTEGYHNVNATQETFPSNPESFGNSLGFDWTYSHVFNTPGTYDYWCDAHYSLGMVGKVIVNEGSETEFNLTVDFSAMNPHIGQTLWLALTDTETGVELERKKVTASAEFTVMFSGIEKDHSYKIDFFADHNKNGMYDAPPADHAWRLELNDVAGDTSLTFIHNTSFTDIMWKNKLTVNFMNMNPHAGQDFHLAVYDKSSGTKLKEVDTTAGINFMIYVFGIENGMSYNVDFWADHNSNGMYDSPPADHAWRIDLDNVTGDTILDFTHNTNFTDIGISTGINESSQNFVKMYPNPARNKVTVEAGDFNTAEFQILIYDIAGKLKYSSQKADTDKLDLDISHLLNGIYIVELRTNDNRKMLKLLKD